MRSNTPSTLTTGGLKQQKINTNPKNAVLFLSFYSLSEFTLSKFQNKNKRTYLHCPKVTRQQQDNRHHTGNEAAAEQLTQEIDYNRTDSKEQMEEGCHWVSGNQDTISSIIFYSKY